MLYLVQELSGARVDLGTWTGLGTVWTLLLHASSQSVGDGPKATDTWLYLAGAYLARPSFLSARLGTPIRQSGNPEWIAWSCQVKCKDLVRVLRFALGDAYATV